MQVSFLPQTSSLNYNSNRQVSKKETKQSVQNFNFTQISLLNFKSNLSHLGAFSSVKLDKNNPKYEVATKREHEENSKLYGANSESEFEKDFDRILNSEGYDRMRLKAQVVPLFDFEILEETSKADINHDDMMTSRMTHVQQVANVAKRISKGLGLNTELTEAIAMGHDLGHTPFGHDGERALRNICKEEGLDPFWHEKNSLKMVDSILTLKDDFGNIKNLNLTYAVRDGIVCHCGEINQDYIKPRDEVLDLSEIKKESKIQPFTWEGCVMKISDKIAYLGRDIEDAQRVGTLDIKETKELNNIVKKYFPDFKNDISNSFLVNLFVDDLIKNSSPEKGITFSKKVTDLMNEIKDFNYKHIYLVESQKFSEGFYYKVLRTIYDNYNELYDKKDYKNKIYNNKFNRAFRMWLEAYSENFPYTNQNHKIYDLRNKKDYQQAIIDYISGMTDSFAIKNYKYIIEHQEN